MSKKELLPCPFCGSKARLVRIAAGCAAECTGCDVRMMLGSVGVGWYATEDEAAADWNRRQPSAPAAPAVYAIPCRKHPNAPGGSVPACRSDCQCGDRLAHGAHVAPVAQAEQYGSYVTTPGEMVAGIALRQLGDESRWVEIRDLNASAFPDMGPNDYLPVGTKLVMPKSAPPAQPDASVLVEALEQIIQQYPNPNFSHAGFRVHACQQAEHALAEYRAALAGKGGAR